MYAMMSAADYWRLGEDSYDLCVEKDCQYYSSWTIDIKGSGSNLTLRVDPQDRQPRDHRRTSGPPVQGQITNNPAHQRPQHPINI